MTSPQQHHVPPPVHYPPTPKPWSASAIVGFVLSLLWGFGVLSFIGACVCVMGLVETAGNRKRGRDLAAWGLVIGLIGVAWLVWMATIVAG